MNIERAISVTNQPSINRPIAFFAFSFSNQVRGWTPLRKKTNLLAMLTHTTLMASSKLAPMASFIFPLPNIIPKVTAGGNNATATITPTRIPDKPVVSESVAAVPDTSAKAIESRFASVRDISS